MACVYKDCDNRYRAFTSTNYFYLPGDNRRATWIHNSGNLKLKDGPQAKNVRFCETHFDPKYFRRQFNRTTLRRDAVPYNYYEINNCAPSPEPPVSHGTEEDCISKLATNEKNSKTDVQQMDIMTMVDLSNVMDENEEELFENSNCAEEDYLEATENQENEIVEGVELKSIDLFPSNEMENDIFPEIEKTFVDSSTQTTDDLCWVDKQQAKPSKNYLSQNGGEYDEDEHFILSLIGPLHRLPHNVKTSVRLSILEVIAKYEAQIK